MLLFGFDMRSPDRFDFGKLYVDSATFGISYHAITAYVVIVAQLFPVEGSTGARSCEVLT